MLEPSFPLPSLTQAWFDAAYGLGWLANNKHSDVKLSADNCLLKALVSHPHLTSRGRASIEALLQRGVSLRMGWPRSYPIDRWLGTRLYLAHASHFSPHVQFASLVSSRLGRDFNRLPHWPSLLESALRSIRSQRSTLLLAPRTTLFEQTRAFAQKADLPSVALDIASDSENIACWIRRALEYEKFSEQIFVSPETTQQYSESCDSIPLRDRAAILLADKVFVLSVRAGGSVSRLVQQRLESPNYVVGSVWLRADATEPTKKRELSKWLDLGAVGWYLTPKHEHDRRLCGCSSRPAVFTQQIATRTPEQWYQAQDDDWPWLAHCTRANVGPRPNESQEQYRDRLWMEGHAGVNHPLRTLHQICSEKLLRGASRMTRTSASAISFSAVRLPHLLAHRSFRSHLARWDWEPYGILIHGDVLKSLGARPVVYGTEQDYLKLSASEQAYFQPAGKNDRWKKEKEWRLLGDLSLTSIPFDAIRVFVRSRVEAMQFCRRVPWSVVWTQDAS